MTNHDSHGSICSLDVMEAFEASNDNCVVRMGDDCDDDHLGSGLEKSIIQQRSRMVGIMHVVVLLQLVLAGTGLTIAAVVVLYEPVFAAVLAGMYILQVAIMLYYKTLVSSRHEAVMDLHKQSKMIVDSLFPLTVRQRLLRQSEPSGRNGNNPTSTHMEDEYPLRQKDSGQPNLTQSINNGSQNFNEPFRTPSEEQSPAKDKQGAGFIRPVTSVVKPVTRMGRKLFSVVNDVSGKAALLNFISQGDNNKNGKDNGSEDLSSSEDEPIADFFEDATVVFIDLAGFTAWSSERDPPQVFRLLEAIYSAFDELAARLKVFKVETIGDCYMAVTGVPEPSKAHAVNMARFAYQCVMKMKAITEQLEAQLGPGTKDLACRVGIHSGPVTAGVLRGQKSRFQLFGDTVNTASRMESTGVKGKIQISKATADLLILAGKSRWITPREDKIVAKGKGELETYWVDPQKKTMKNGKTVIDCSLHDEARRVLGGGDDEEDDNDQRSMLSESNASFCDSQANMEESNTSICFDGNDNGSHLESEGGDVLTPIINLETVSRGRTGPPRRGLPPRSMPEKLSLVTASKRHLRLESDDRDTLEEKCCSLIEWNTDVLLSYLEAVITYRQPVTSRSVVDVDHSDESSVLMPAAHLVTDVFVMPEFVPLSQRKQEPSSFELEQAHMELKTFVSEIAVLYNDIPFHNFEHSSHVTLACNKLLGKISRCDTLSEYELHQRSFGISSDPLTKFAMIFACVIHDVGHIGISNDQLIREGSSIAMRYQNQSIAEQNSFAIAWQLLMEKRFQFLRSCIYKTNAERKRFREILVNAVMATDVHDSERAKQRQERWEIAFRDYGTNGDGRNLLNKRASVVIEGLIQMADVSHTMQHWNMYRRWNERLFEEMVNAFRIGRATWNPADVWYKGELSFFEKFVIPLAKRLNESGVFGPGGGLHFISFAEENWNEWKCTGKTLLLEMQERIHSVNTVVEEELDHSESNNECE